MPYRRTLTDNTGSPTDAGRARSGSRRRLWVLVLTGLLLAAQGAYSLSTRPEPYPTVRMPVFGNAPTEDGLWETESLGVTVGYTDGTTSSAGVRELMGGVRGNWARPTLENAFWSDGDRPRAVDDPETRAWLTERAREVGDGREPAWLEVARCEVDVDVRTRRETVVDCETKRIEL